MQTGTAYRYFQVNNTLSGQVVPHAAVTVHRSGGGGAGALAMTYTTDANGLLATASGPGMGLAFGTNVAPGDYTVTLDAVNNAPVGNAGQQFTITAKPFEYTEKIKAGASMGIGGKLLGGKGTLGAAGSLS